MQGYWDDLFDAERRKIEATGKRVAWVDLVDLLQEQEKYPMSIAREIVDDYCGRYSLKLRQPKKPSVPIFLTLFILWELRYCRAPFSLFAVHHLAASTPHSNLLIFGKYCWALLLSVLLIQEVRTGSFKEARTVACQVTPGIVLQNIVVLAVTAAVALLLALFCPFLNCSWLYKLPGYSGPGFNIAIAPFTIKYLGLPFAILLAVNVPRAARSEEISYRRGTQNWKVGRWRSLHFGLLHCLMGIPIYAGLALSVGGLWYTHQYLKGGISRSTLHHSTYNWIGLTILSTILFVRL